MKLKYHVLALFLLSQVALGQELPDSLKSKKWLRTIQNNALEAGSSQAMYKPANSGYALYFSRADTINVPYLVHVPKSYNPQKSYPLLVYLHGGVVSLKNFEYKDPEFAEEPIFTVADKYNAIVLFPFGKKDFGWVGQQKAFENILAMLHQTKQVYNIDERQVYLGGMSNGGTGTFWFISHAPEHFAGFYTFSAHPELKTGAIDFSNISQDKPLYSLHAKDDKVFPYDAVKEIYDAHKADAPAWHFEVLDSGGHGFIYRENGEETINQVLRKLLNQLSR